MPSPSPTPSSSYSPSPSPISSPSPSPSPPVDSLISHAEALAAALQAEFPAVSIGGTSYPVSITWTDLPEVDIADAKIKTPLVWVLDVSETLGVHTTLPVYDERELLIIVQMKVDADQSTEAARAMLALCYKMRGF